MLVAVYWWPETSQSTVRGQRPVPGWRVSLRGGSWWLWSLRLLDSSLSGGWKCRHWTHAIAQCLWLGQTQGFDVQGRWEPLIKLSFPLFGEHLQTSCEVRSVGKPVLHGNLLIFLKRTQKPGVIDRELLCNVLNLNIKIAASLWFLELGWVGTVT